MILHSLCKFTKLNTRQFEEQQHKWQPIKNWNSWGTMAQNGLCRNSVWFFVAPKGSLNKFYFLILFGSEQLEVRVKEKTALWQKERRKHCFSRNAHFFGMKGAGRVTLDLSGDGRQSRGHPCPGSTSDSLLLSPWSRRVGECLQLTDPHDRTVTEVSLVIFCYLVLVKYQFIIFMGK